MFITFPVRENGHMDRDKYWLDGKGYVLPCKKTFYSAQQYRRYINGRHFALAYAVIFYCNTRAFYSHDDVIKYIHFPPHWPFLRGIHRCPVNSPSKGQWRGALMFTLICARINGWVNNREAGDLRCNRAHYDVIVMIALPGTSIHWAVRRLIARSRHEAVRLDVLMSISLWNWTDIVAALLPRCLWSVYSIGKV